MKKLLLAIHLGASISASAAHRGYLYTDLRGDMYYSGIDDTGKMTAGFKIDYALSVGSITRAQLNSMINCMKQKTTHAIQIVKKSELKSEVPSDIPGRSTTFHTSVYSVKCVEAPKLLDLWRQLKGIR